MSTAAERLASFTSELTVERIPDEVVAAAQLHLLDALGCGLAAHALGVAPDVHAAFAEPGVSGPAAAIGVPDGLPATSAALLNGAICHSLDFDDTHSGAVAHVSVAVAPAALAAAQVLGATGPELVAALVAGNETVIRLGMAASAAFHARGFHPTAVCGVFGATAAAARLRGLDRRTTVNALGIAGSLASGILEYLADGSSTKRLHAGWAAHAGLLAAQMAAAGSTGPSTVIEGRFGLYRTFLGRDDVDIDSQLADLGERWETPRIAYKPYPACHYLHASVSAAEEAVAAEPIRPGDVEEIVATVPQAGVALVLEPLHAKLRPRSEYDAKFSLPYSVASLLVRGRVDVKTYTEPLIREEEVLALAARVRYEVRDYPSAAHAFPGGIRIRTRDGRTLEADLEFQRGAPENPMTDAQVREKFRTNAELALSGSEADTLEGAVLALAPAGDLAGLEALGRAGRRQEVAA